MDADGALMDEPLTAHAMFRRLFFDSYFLTVM
jgi:hypothetical protein